MSTHGSSLRTRRSVVAPTQASSSTTAASPYPRRNRSALTKQVSYVEVPVGADDFEPDAANILDEEEDDSTPRPIAIEDDDEDADDAEESNAENSSAPTGRSSRGGTKRGRGRPKLQKRGTGSRTSFQGGKRKRGAPTTDVEDEGDDGVDVEPDVEEEEPSRVNSDEEADEQGRGYVPKHKVKNLYYDVIDDEVEMEDSETGDKKIDAKGRLLGGREYKVMTFTSPSRSDPDRLYCLSIDAARACGYRETSDFVRKCPLLVKLAMTLEEKDMVMELTNGQRNMKQTSMTILACRNIFKYQGAKFIKGGKWVVDHYYEKSAAEECAEAGASPGEPLGDITYKAIHRNPRQALQERSLGAPFYTPNGPTTHWGQSGQDPWSEFGPVHKKARLANEGVTKDNWMWRMAVFARELEQEMMEERKVRLKVFKRDEKVAVYHEQYEEEEDEGDEDDKEEVRVKTDGDERMEENTSVGKSSTLKSNSIKLKYKVPTSSTLDGLLSKDSEGTNGTSHPRMETDDNENKALNAFDEGNGGIVVESKKQTLMKQKRNVKSLVPGEMMGTYEPHTNLVHVPLDTQSTLTTSINRLSPLPYLSLPNAPPFTAHLTFNSVLGRKTVGTSASGFSSWEYVYQDKKDEEMNKVGEMESLVREAEEWDIAQREVQVCVNVS